MPLLFWDASALAKRYFPEVGSDIVDVSLAADPALQMFGTVLGYAETFSTLLRRYHQGAISLTAFNTAKTSLRNEVADDPSFTLLSMADEDIFAGIDLMEQYHVNSSDGAILALFLRYMRALPARSPACVLVASDRRLVNAAGGEGLPTLNPEIVTAIDVPAFFASL